VEALSVNADGPRGCSVVINDLPYPPTVNTYWRRVGDRTIVSRAGRRYRDRVASILSLYNIPEFGGPIEVSIEVHPPDRRRRDLDNLLKALLDALERGGAYRDDSQIEQLMVLRGDVEPGGGGVTVHISGDL